MGVSCSHFLSKHTKTLHRLRTASVVLGTFSQDKFNLETKASKRTERWRHRQKASKQLLTRGQEDKTTCLMYQRTKMIPTPEQTGHHTPKGIRRATNSLSKETAQVRGVRLMVEERWAHTSCQTHLLCYTCAIHRRVRAPWSGLSGGWRGGSCLPLQAVLGPWTLLPTGTLLLRH